MEFVNLARRTEIGANSYLLRVGGRSIVLDCGMHPKERGLAALPDYSLVPPGSVDAVVISHAHQDHIGSLPVLTRREQQARVFLTEATRRIGEIMLHNSVNVMTRQREDDGMTEYPLFTHRGIEFSRAMWRPAPARVTFTLDGERGTGDGAEPTLEFYHAGHILGSSGVLIRGEGRTVFYTGDVNFDAQTLMRGADFPTEGVDVLVMETTRGDAPMPADFTRAAEERRFAAAIRAAFDRGGSVTVPVFALGKTQEILAMLWSMRRGGELAQTPIYIGGLSTKITSAYDAFARSADRSRSELALLHEMAPYVLSGNEVHTMAARKHCIFALSSGMMTEHTLSNLWVRKILPDPKQALFFVGYSDPDSPAGRLRRAKPGDKVVLDPDLPPVEFRCHLESFNFSAHSAREPLLNYAVALRPKKILLVHGDPPAIEWFRSQLASLLPGTEVVVPAPGAALPL
ncbi:MAG: MBL fold metallo-hydrolase [Terrimicrobiaceae bacterium]|nr:MBL fold metallo-hydrolase [Terrimicrobiaceae bacterium]